MRTLSILFLAAAVAGCGGSGGGNNDGGGGSGGGDMAKAGTGGNGSGDMSVAHGPSDMSSGGHGGFVCGSQTCGAGTQCCVVGTTPMCSNSCPDGGFVASCSAPSECSSGSACCITAKASPFGVESISCKAAASCVPAVNAGTGVVLTRACVTDSDCTDNNTNQTMFGSCCKEMTTGRNACFSKLLAGTAWTCP